MKKVLNLALTALAALVLFSACNEKSSGTDEANTEGEEVKTEETEVAAEPKEEEAESTEAWAEFDAFHDVMANTYHPAEEGDLDPVKSRAAELAEKAEAWMNSTPPAEFNKEEIKEGIKTIAEESKALAEKVASATDEEIKSGIVALHDRYHEIAGMCKHTGEGHDHGHDPNHKGHHDHGHDH